MRYLSSISKVYLKYSRSIAEVYLKCAQSIAEVARLTAAMLPRITAAVPLSLCCCCACQCRSCLAAPVHGALASLLPCPSRVAAAVRNLHRGCCAALAHHCPCAALALLLLWRSRIAAAVALSRRCHRAALAFPSARAPAGKVSLIDVKPRTRRHAG